MAIAIGVGHSRNMVGCGGERSGLYLNLKDALCLSRFVWVRPLILRVCMCNPCRSL